jgi:hypothetical protein
VRAAGSEAAMSVKTRTVKLHKGSDIFIVNYDVGYEPQAIDCIVAMVKNQSLKFDWFDAAIMSNQIGQNLAKEISKMVPA